MAATNTINLLKWWYPNGLDVTQDHDDCTFVTGRYDIWVYLPKCDKLTCLMPSSKRSILQNWLDMRNMMQKQRMRFVWRDDQNNQWNWKKQAERKAEKLIGKEEKNISSFDFDNYDVNGTILLTSMKYLGSDQFLYDRADQWPCFWKGVEVASTGWNDVKSQLAMENMSTFLEGLGKSTWPGERPGNPSPLEKEGNCGVPFGYPQIGFNIEAWMFHRVFSPYHGTDWIGSVFANGDTNLAKTWAACRFWYDTHTFGYARVIPFVQATPALVASRDVIKTHPQFFGGKGLLALPNPHSSRFKIDDFAQPILQEPVTDPFGGLDVNVFLKDWKTLKVLTFLKDGKPVTETPKDVSDTSWDSVKVDGQKDPVAKERVAKIIVKGLLVTSPAPDWKGFGHQ